MRLIDNRANQQTHHQIFFFSIELNPALDLSPNTESNKIKPKKLIVGSAAFISEMRRIPGQ